ncbi:hypothetical protein VFPBJ_06353 [Purpureocillium lilacinum]|uniref:Uncharacterized protein n=1 Tax=Purpureocillium lilacinum TaxID=33203 RepID=A0A179GK27_PURLI|nr:hypothetical protein VFPBJ_06353 [Purpureocillium lilacinum]
MSAAVLVGAPLVGWSCLPGASPSTGLSRRAACVPRFRSVLGLHILRKASRSYLRALCTCARSLARLDPAQAGSPEATKQRALGPCRRTPPRPPSFIKARHFGRLMESLTLRRLLPSAMRWPEVPLADLDANLGDSERRRVARRQLCRCA